MRWPMDIDQALCAVLAACAPLDLCELLPGEHQRLGAQVHPGGRCLVLSVERALRFDPDLFPAQVARAAPLLALQARADALRSLREGLALLLRRVADSHLLAQASAIAEARAILEETEREDGLPPRPGATEPAPDRTLRRAALHEARSLLRLRQRRKRQAALRRSLTAPAAPPPAP